MVYFFRDQNVRALILYENGIWRKAARPKEQFIFWNEIESVALKSFHFKGATYRYLAIYTYDLENRWNKLSFIRKVFWFFDKAKFGTHIFIMITNGLDITPDELLELVERQIDKKRSENKQ